MTVIALLSAGRAGSAKSFSIHFILHSQVTPCEIRLCVCCAVPDLHCVRKWHISNNSVCLYQTVIIARETNGMSEVAFREEMVRRTETFD
jgi:hypothetical protein